MLCKDPGAMKKGIRDFHSEETQRANVHKRNALEDTQIGHRHDDRREVMHDNAGLEKMLAPGCADQVDAHGEHQDRDGPVQALDRKPLCECKDKDGNRRRNETPLELHFKLLHIMNVHGMNAMFVCISNCGSH